MKTPSKLDVFQLQSNSGGFFSRSFLLFLGLSCSDPCSKGGFGGSALLDTCMTAASLLENDERLEDAIEFLVHNLKGSLHLVKGEGMGRHERWIDTLHLQHAQEAFHAQTATRTQSGRNGLFRHADSPLDARDMHEVTLTVIANIGDGAASFRDFDSILEGDIRPQRLDSCVHPLSISQIEDALDNILFGEISDRIGTIGARKFLSARYRFYSDDQPGPTQLRSYCCHQSHRTLCKDSYCSPNRNIAVLCTHEPGREHVCTVDRHLIRHACRNTGHIRIGLVHMEVLGKHTILRIGEFPSSQRCTRLGGVTSLRSRIAPIRSDCANQDAITWLEELDVAANFMDGAHRFVSQGQVLARADGTAYRMGVRGTNEGFGRFDDRIVWTRLGNGFLHEAHLTDSFHDKSFHAHSFLCLVVSACIRTPTGVRRITGRYHIPWGNIVSRLPLRKHTLVRSHTHHSKSLFRHHCITMCSRQSEAVEKFRFLYRDQ